MVNGLKRNCRGSPFPINRSKRYIYYVVKTVGLCATLIQFIKLSPWTASYLRNETLLTLARNTGVVASVDNGRWASLSARWEGIDLWTPFDPFSWSPVDSAGFGCLFSVEVQHDESISISGVAESTSSPFKQSSIDLFVQEAEEIFASS